MTVFRNTAEGGSNGVTVTNGNSGGTSGTALRTNIVSTSALVYSTAHPTQGAIGFKHDNVASGCATLRTASGLSSMNSSFSMDFVYDSGYTGSHPILNCLNGTAESLFKLYLQADGTMRGRQRGAVTNTTGLSSLTTALTSGTAYRLDANVQPGTGTGNGVIKYQICLQNSNTPIFTCNLTTADAGTTPIVEWAFGQSETTATAFVIYTDDIRWDDAAGGSFLGAYVPPTNVKPIAVAPAKQLITSGQSATLSGSDSDSDGTVTTRLWTATSWPAGASIPTFTGGSGATATAITSVLTVPGHYLFEYKVMDNLSEWSDPVTAKVGVADAAGYASVRTDKSNPGLWTGTMADVSELTVDDNTFWETPSAPNNADRIVWMNPILAGPLTFDRLRSFINPVGGAACTVKIGIISGTGSTPFAERTFNLTSTATNYPVSDLDSGEQAAFTDRIDWAIVITGDQT